jgi:3-hydroxy-3-methylglutaryl CoA synthase
MAAAGRTSLRPRVKPTFNGGAVQASEGVRLQRQLGNLYTASLYSGLAALLAQQGSALAGKRVLCFSFGSGVVSSMFVLRGRGLQEGPLQHHLQQQQHCSLQDMADQVGVKIKVLHRYRPHLMMWVSRNRIQQ